MGYATRRSELAALKCGHIQQRDGRWVFVDLVGKGKRIRTVPIPPFVKVVIDAWTAAAGLSEGPLHRRSGLHQETKQLLKILTRLTLETSVPDDFATLVDPIRKGGWYHIRGNEGKSKGVNTLLAKINPCPTPLLSL